LKAIDLKIKQKTKHLKMNVFFLLEDVLKDHKIPPDLLKISLESYLKTLNQYLNSPDIEKKEVEFILGKELGDVVESFAHLLDYSIRIKKKEPSNQ
jgi:hypothetical protein